MELPLRNHGFLLKNGRLLCVKSYVLYVYSVPVLSLAQRFVLTTFVLIAYSLVNTRIYKELISRPATFLLRVPAHSVLPRVLGGVLRTDRVLTDEDTESAG